MKTATRLPLALTAAILFGGLPSGAGSATRGRPDLVVTRVTVDPEHPPSGAGNMVRFTATVRNRGDGAAAESSAQYELLDPDRRSIDSNSTYTVPALASGARSTVTAIINRGVHLEPGSPYVVRFCANSSYRHIEETSERNNCYDLPFQTAGQPPPASRPGALPDLIVAGWTVSPSDPLRSDSFTIRCTVRNSGQGRSAPSDASVTIVPAKGTSVARSTEIGPLAPGERTTVEAVFGSTPYVHEQGYIPAGSHTVRFCVNAGRRFSESDHENNCHEFPLLVRRDERQLPDLVVTGIAVNPEHPPSGTGNMVELTATFRNTGRGPSVQASASYDVLDPSGRSVDGNSTYTILPMASGARATSTAIISRNVHLEPGSRYTARFCANSSYKQIEETNADNNCYDQPFRTAGEPPPGSRPGTLPDLFVAGWSVSPGDPSRDDTLTVRCTVRNRGQGRAAPSDVSVSVVGQGGICSGTSAEIGPLGPGDSTSEPVLIRSAPTSSAPGYLRAGSNTLRCCANAARRFTESDYDNNCSDFSLVLRE